MPFKVLFGIALAAFSASHLGAATSNWAIGQEREVDEGFYFKLLKVEAGWRLWRIETKDGVECRAVKSANGRPHPYPLGVSVNFFGGEPFIVLYKSDALGGVQHFWKGVDLSNKSVQVRRLGEKFWHEDTRQSVYSDGDKLEINIVSWEYPEIHVGYHETRGTFNFEGLDAMRKAVEDCH
tara:strand:- start:408 stop:947 length:540 start_codon:yes stop_codon:yes gene_type:complete